MRSLAKDQEMLQLLNKECLYCPELQKLMMVYAVFLSCVEKALDEEEHGHKKVQLHRCLIPSDLDNYRTSGSCAVLQLSETCNDVAMGKTVKREHVRLANSILRYIINPREAIQKEAHS